MLFANLPDLSVGSVTAEAKSGEAVKVPIKANANAGYTAGTVDLQWNSDVFTLTEIAYAQYILMYAVKKLAGLNPEWRDIIQSCEYIAKRQNRIRLSLNESDKN